MNDYTKEQMLESKIEEQKRYIERLENQNQAMRRIIRDPDRFPLIPRERKYS